MPSGPTSNAAGEPRRGSSPDLTGLLGDAVERAVAIARRDASSPGGEPPPQAIRPLLRFTRLPARAMEVVRSVLDRDDDFRRHVAEGLLERDVDRASWLFLTRPDGWSAELELIEAAAAEEHADAAASREANAASRRAAQLDEQVARLREEVDGLTRALSEAEELASSERRARADSDAALDRLSARIDQLDGERARAVKELKQTEALAADRLEQLRQAQDRLEELEGDDEPPATPQRSGAVSGPEPLLGDGPSPARRPGEGEPESPRDRDRGWSEVDRATLAKAVSDSAEAAAALAGSLRVVATSLGEPHDTSPSGAVGGGREQDGSEPLAPSGPPDGVATPSPRGAPARPTRRSPVRLRRGVRDDTPEAVEQLLEVDGLVVVVDGYNVTMERWPAMDGSAQRASLIRALGGLAARHRREIHVVFDGDDDGARPAVGVPLPVRVHFSPSEEEADDRILAMVAAFPTDRPVMVVSSDRKVAEGARRLGANAVRSSQLIDVLPL